ncbi:MAG: hypothetical protein XXXNARYT_002775 [Candidatus Accumulibacter regalis]|jgi:hypothetical protein|uniref:hypothetical protein n=1 Tax=Accumulibacter sp. TaxID=2053492 RepID=UPI00260B63B3|nr:hypothetical protein [Accumulibacter sp.]
MQQKHAAPSIRPAAKLSTEEVAAALLVLPQTVRRSYCSLGHFHGLIPIKLANRRLAWNVDEVNALVAGESAKTPEAGKIDRHFARKAANPARLPEHIARKVAAKRLIAGEVAK